MVSESEPQETSSSSVPLVGGLLAACALLCFALFGPSLIKTQSAMSWVATKCRIEPSPARRGGRGSEPELSYSYTVDGREYRSDQFQFGSFFSLSAKSKQALSKEYPAGTELECFYNPDDPKEAVINRSLNPDIIFNVFPLILLGIGLCGLAVMLMTAPTPSIPDQMVPDAPAPAPPEVSIATGVSSGSVRLSPRFSYARLYEISLVVCGAWNAALILVAVFAPVDFGPDGPLWAKVGYGLLVLLGGLFVLTSALLRRARRRPRIGLSIGVTRLPLGGWTLVNWEITGQSQSVRNLEIYLEGTEEVRAKKGRWEAKEIHRFAHLPICDLSDSNKMLRGEAVIEIPHGIMHSLQGQSHQIVWTLNAIGSIDGGRELRERHRIVITPLHPEDIHA